MRDFKKYEIWQMSHDFTLEIYKITSQYPKEEIYGLISQIRRASSSIPTNINEGCGRNSDKAFNQFLNIALGSANETEYAKDFLDKINSIKSKIYSLKQKLISPTA